jgi:hypothetical protein
MRYASYAAFGVGAAGIGVGIAFALQSASKRKQADDLCPNPDRCQVVLRNTVDPLDDEGRKAQTLSAIGFAIGGVGVASGVVLLVLGKKSDAPRTAFVRPWVGPTSFGLDGRF